MIKLIIWSEAFNWFKACWPLYDTSGTALPETLQSF